MNLSVVSVPARLYANFSELTQRDELPFLADLPEVPENAGLKPLVARAGVMER
jgi:hypothetical protein